MSGPISQPAPADLKRILFVDDDPSILDGLRNALRPQRREWDMTFALGPEEALAKIAAQSFDVVVSDMRMPHTDGATLLAKVKQLQPRAVRIILTGQTEQESVMKPSSSRICSCPSPATASSSRGWSAAPVT
ncbi:MAG: response regulator [Polyangia bacterium]